MREHKLQNDREDCETIGTSSINPSFITYTEAPDQAIKILWNGQVYHLSIVDPISSY